MCREVRQHVRWLKASGLLVGVPLLVVCLFADLSAGYALEGESSSPVKQVSPLKEDQIWLVSTRHLCADCREASDELDLEVLRYDEEDQWTTASAEALFEASKEVITIIYVHGNRTEWNDSFRHGWEAYHALASEDRPLRFVIWSWPSDQIHGQAHDVRTKARRADVEARYLSWFVTHFKPEEQVSLVGFSFGGRIITGALHLLGGGTICGQSFPAGAGLRRTGARVVLLGAALDRDWLLPGGARELAWSTTDRLLLLYNSCDPALKRYRCIDRRRRPIALGYTGLHWIDSVSGSEQLDACCHVGRSHSETPYFSSARLVDLMRSYTVDDDGE